MEPTIFFVKVELDGNAYESDSFEIGDSFYETQHEIHDVLEKGRALSLSSGNNIHIFNPDQLKRALITIVKE